jgi:hypothetical protein
MAGAFLLVMAAVFFNLGYVSAVAQPWRDLQLGLYVENIFSNSTLVGNSTLTAAGKTAAGTGRQRMSAVVMRLQRVPLGALGGLKGPALSLKPLLYNCIFPGCAPLNGWCGVVSQLKWALINLSSVSKIKSSK